MINSEIASFPGDKYFQNTDISSVGTQLPKFPGSNAKVGEMAGSFWDSSLI